MRFGVVLLGLAVVFAAVPAVFGSYLGGNPNANNGYYDADRIDLDDPSDRVVATAGGELAFEVESDAPSELDAWRAPGRTPDLLWDNRNASVETNSTEVATDLRALDRQYAFYSVDGTYYAFTVTENGTTLAAPRVNASAVLERGFETRLVAADTLRPDRRQFVENLLNHSRASRSSYHPGEEPPPLTDPFVSVNGTVYHVYRAGHTDHVPLPIVGLLGYGGAILSVVVGGLCLLTGIALTVRQYVRSDD